jgi:ribosomal protein S18 acetylase RimI-like enzyme
MTVAPSAAVRPRADLSTDALRVAIHDDLVASAIRRRTIAGERVIRTPELVAYTCDIGSQDVNEVVGARFGPDDAADAAIEATIALFGGRPFLWWLGEDDRPADLGDRLTRHGIGYIDDIPGMAMDLAELAAAEAAPPPPELSIRPVLDADAMRSFHAVLIQGFPEDFVDEGAEAEIGRASARAAAESGYREPSGLPTRWLGSVDGRPVTTTRLHTAAGVAGIYTVITAADARRRGHGEAVTRHVLHVARDAGLRIATLQASSAGRGIYERIGFRELVRYRLHEWRPPVAGDRP